MEGREKNESASAQMKVKIDRETRNGEDASVMWRAVDRIQWSVLCNDSRRGTMKMGYEEESVGDWGKP